MSCGTPKFLFVLGLACMMASPVPARSGLAEERLADIALKEERIYKKIAEDPEFYSADDLDRHLSNLIASYGAYLLDHPEDVDALILYGKLLRRVMNLFSISVEEGAATGIYLATSPEVEDINGQYFEQATTPTRSSDASYDQDAQRRLWAISAEITGLGTTS